MTALKAPPFMDRIAIHSGGGRDYLEIPFGPGDGLLHDGHIPLATVLVGGRELSLTATADWPKDPKDFWRSRLELSVIKNGQPFHVISHGALALVIEIPHPDSPPSKLYLSYGQWE